MQPLTLHLALLALTLAPVVWAVDSEPSLLAEDAVSSPSERSNADWAADFRRTMGALGFRDECLAAPWPYAALQRRIVPQDMSVYGFDDVTIDFDPDSRPHEMAGFLWITTGVGMHGENSQAFLRIGIRPDRFSSQIFNERLSVIQSRILDNGSRSAGPRAPARMDESLCEDLAEALPKAMPFSLKFVFSGLRETHYRNIICEFGADFFRFEFFFSTTLNEPLPTPQQVNAYVMAVLTNISECLKDE